MTILEEENFYIKSTIGMLEERVRLSNEARRTNPGPYSNDEKLEDNGCPDIDVKVSSGLSLATEVCRDIYGHSCFACFTIILSS